ncbi:MAG: hypothetical protein WD407_14435 [Rhodospirillales bacterium]
MTRIGILIIAGLLLAGCATSKSDEAYYEAFYSEACTFDYDSFQEYKPGSPEHEFCMELARSGIEPWEDLRDGGGGGDMD